MTSDDIENLMIRAERELELAENELRQSPEDVVSSEVCIHARRALYKFLQVLALLYAKENNESIGIHTSIEKLIGFASRYNTTLRHINFSYLHCKCNDVTTSEEKNLHCPSVHKVRYCVSLAKSVQQIIREKELNHVHI